MNIDELIEEAREHIRSYGYNGFADHTVMPTLMAEFAKMYHDSEVKKLNLPDVVLRSEQLPPPQICYKTNEPCKHDCKGLCKESC